MKRCLLVFIILFCCVSIFIYFYPSLLLRWDKASRTVYFLLYETDHHAILDAWREVLTIPLDERRSFSENEHLPEILQEWLREQDELNLLGMHYTYFEDTELWLYFGGGHFQCGLLVLAERVEQHAAAQYSYRIQILDGLFYFDDGMGASLIKGLKPAHLPKPMWWSQL